MKKLILLLLITGINYGQAIFTRDSVGTAYPRYYSPNQTRVLLDAKQATLVSGTNIKTINSNSLLGSGDISVAALIGYTPYNATNPSNYIPLTALSSTATGLTYTNTTGVFSWSTGYEGFTTTLKSNYDLAYTDRLKWDGGAAGLTASTGRASLDVWGRADSNTTKNPTTLTYLQNNYYTQAATNTLLDAKQNIITNLADTTYYKRDINLYSSSVTLTVDDYYVLITNGAASDTVTLPITNIRDGKGFAVKKEDDGVGTTVVIVEGGGTVDGEASMTINYKNTSYVFVKYGSNYYTF